MIPGSANPLLLRSAAVTGYQIQRSLRFNSSDSAYLSRTPASAGNRKTFTYSAWIKRSKLDSEYEMVFSARAGSSSQRDQIGFTSDGPQRFYIDLFDSSGNATVNAKTNALFRDPSAWYHFVIAFDTTQSIASNRIKAYVNGTELSFSTSSWPSQNADLNFNSTVVHTIGQGATGTAYGFNGYLADVHFIDGQALTPSSFTEVSATTGQLIPKAYTGSYGTNGFKLTFSDNSTAAALGTDTSGNGNTWTVNNISAGTSASSPVSSSTGALPIYNTTDTYGTVKGTGTRTDSNSSSIVLAVAMDGANGGTTFSDLSATIKGSGSAKTITNSNVTTATAQSKYYGSSGLFDSGADNLTVPAGADFAYGTGNVTWECWVYPTSYPNTYIQVLWSQDASGLNYLAAGLLGNYFGVPGKFTAFGITSTYVVPLNRWTHLAAVRSSGIVSLYVNGISVASGYNTTNYSDTTRNPAIGGYPWDTSSNFYGYMQDVRVYKGTAKYTTDFIPPTATGDPYINAACDSLVDTPTSYGTDTGVGGEVRGNYCTFNPLDNRRINLPTNGNLELVSTGGSDRQGFGTIHTPGSGKWYWEATIGLSASGLVTVGIVEQNTSSASIGYFNNGNKRVNGADSAYGASFNNGDIIGVAVNCDTQTVTFYKNNVSQGSVSFSSGMNGYVTASSYTAGNVGDAVYYNWGQRPWAYAAPSGFKALCDTNLPAPVVAKPSTVMDVALWTGNGSARSITGLGFSPDFVWIKGRSGATDHALYDAVRGATIDLVSNSTAAETTQTQGLTAFNSDGFSLGTLAKVNTNSATYAGWAWDAGTTTASNGSGSITSSVRANASAGFSIVTYTGNGTDGATVGHGLGVAPQLIILKARGNAYNWGVWHTSIGKYDANHSYALALNLTRAADATAQYAVFYPGLNSSTVFGLGNEATSNQSSATYVAYCFAPVAGYSSFGSYTGNGDTSGNGPFVFTGHLSRWLMIKRTDTTGDWVLFDTARDTYNQSGKGLRPNLSDAEYDDSAGIGTAYTSFDFLSNGFKVRGASTRINASGGTYVYASFAQNPFQYARAR